MKVVAKPIEVIAWFDLEGINPMRFKIIEEDDTNQVIKVDRIISKYIEKLAGTPMWVFDCESTINGIVRPYQIKYQILECKWILFKI